MEVPLDRLPRGREDQLPDTVHEGEDGVQQGMEVYAAVDLLEDLDNKNKALAEVVEVGLEEGGPLLDQG